MTDKTEVVKIETKADKIMNSKKVKKEIHDLYMKYYGDYNETN